MSMIAKFVEVAPDRLAGLVEEPDSIMGLFSDDDGAGLEALRKIAQMSPAFAQRREEMARRAPGMLAEAIERMQNPAMREGLKQQLEARGINTVKLRGGSQNEALMKLMGERLRAMAARFAAGGSGPSQSEAKLSLDKAWHGVHYLLCGRAESGSDPLSQVIMGGTEIGDDEGYGPARYFKPSEVVTAANELNASGLEALMQSRFDPARMVNLGIYPGGWTSSSWGWLLDEYRNLKDFFTAASNRHSAVVTCLV
jgi:hypothetical protein